MKSITSVIYGVFAAEGTITALVAANNIMSAPADLSVATFPLITFSEENRNTDILITGQPSGLVESTLVIQCAGKTPQSALAVAEVVNTFLNGKTASAIGSLYCVMCYNTGSSDGFDDDAQAHIVTLTYAITYR